MYLTYFFLTFILSFISSLAVFFLMRSIGIVDRPKGDPRKIHKKPVPLGGGLAIFISVFAAIAAALYGEGAAIQSVSRSQLFGLFAGGCILMIGGALDDCYRWPPWKQAWFPVAAATVAVYFGIAPSVITNPFGGAIRLDRGLFLDSATAIVTLGDVVAFFWLSMLMFATKLLDGLDGLVAGMVAIGAAIIFFLSRQAAWYQPDVALLSVILAGACAGFLIWNFHPAKLFLGQGGSLFAGFMLGSLAIISGGKIATTLLVMGIPILDMIRVVIRRLMRHQSIVIGDREHLHYQLLSSGLSHRQAVLLLWAMSLLFGLATLFLQSRQKLIALLLLGVLMLLFGVRFSQRQEIST